MSERHEGSPDDRRRTLERLAEQAEDRGRRIAVAESLTSGALSSRLGSAPGCSTWFAGGVVAYHESVKFDVLGVPEGPVVTAECARRMAVGVRDLLGADLAVSNTGVGGPGPSEGEPAGTVWMAVATADGVETHKLHLAGDPDSVIEKTVDTAIDLLLQSLSQ